MSKLVIRHDLDKLSVEQQIQYLRDVSEFLGIDPDLNAFDMIWMPNPGGPGQTLTVYARRGTCELLREKHMIEIEDQTETVTEGSYVVRVKGYKMVWAPGGSVFVRGRTEIAIGSRSIEGLKGRDRDDAIMTASTRALQRLTMQFTGLGILSESEVVSIFGQPVNPASEAKLAGSAMVLPQAPVNDTPGKPSEMIPVSKDPQTQAQLAAVIAIRELEKTPEQQAANQIFDKNFANPVESTPSAEPKLEESKKTGRRGSRSKTAVSFDVEPERIVKAPETAPVAQEPAVKTLSDPDRAKDQQLTVTVPPQVMTLPGTAIQPPASTITLVQPGRTSIGATDEQMTGYRQRIIKFTEHLTGTNKNGQEMGQARRMRAFIVKFNGGVEPNNLTVEQWEKMLAWFDESSAKNGGPAGVAALIDAALGDK